MVDGVEHSQVCHGAGVELCLRACDVNLDRREVKRIAVPVEKFGRDGFERLALREPAHDLKFAR